MESSFFLKEPAATATFSDKKIPTRRSIQPLGAALPTSVYNNSDLNLEFDVRFRS